MSVYLDTSVLLSVFHEDAHSDRVTEWMAGLDDFVLSRWTTAEMSSALGILVRMRRLKERARRELELRLDGWLADRRFVDIVDGDFAAARRLLREDIRLRTPDALHLAVVARGGHVMATLDRDLAAAASDMGVEVIAP